MAKFKHKKGGTCEVFSLDNIEKLEKDPNFTQIDEKKEPIKAESPKSPKIDTKE